MFENSGYENFTDIRDDILRTINICEERIRLSKSNELLYAQLAKQSHDIEDELNDARETGNHLNRMVKNIKFFLENKKTISKQVLEDAIHSVSAIVEDSDLINCTIEHKNGKTYILDEFGHSINRCEGSAARATMGFMLRYACLKAKPNKIQIMFLDEALATLSTSSSVNLKSVIEAFSKDVGIVGIEQKDVLYSDLAQKKYIVNKVGDTSTVREEV